MHHFGMGAEVFGELGRLLADPPALEPAAFSLHLRLGLEAAQVAGVVALRSEDRIGAQSIDPLLVRLSETDEPADAAAELAGMLVVRDDSQLEQWCLAAIEANAQAADDVRSGKMAAIGRLMGYVMKASGGSADAKVVQAKLRELLG